MLVGKPPGLDFIEDFRLQGPDRRSRDEEDGILKVP